MNYKKFFTLSIVSTILFSSALPVNAAVGLSQNQNTQRVQFSNLVEDFQSMPTEETLFIDGQAVTFKYDFKNEHNKVTIENFDGTTILDFNNKTNKISVTSDYLSNTEIQQLENMVTDIVETEPKNNIQTYQYSNSIQTYASDGWLSMGYQYGDTYIRNMSATIICAALSAALKCPASVFFAAASAFYGKLDTVYWKKHVQIRGEISGMARRASIWFYKDPNRTQFINSATYETLELI